jgi:hypothetical protein
MDISGIVYNEQERLKKKETGIKNALENQNRMIFLNQSYASRMKEYSFMIMIIAITIVIVVFISVFQNLLPSFLVTFLIMLTSIIGFIWALKVYWGIQNRDSVDFDKIYSPPASSISDISGNALVNSIDSGDISQASALGWKNICIGNACCSDNTYYSKSSNKCISGFTSLDQAYTNGEIPNDSTIQNYGILNSSLSFNSYS